MASMTRARGTKDHLPTPIMIDYYAQRAGAGLIVSEAIAVTVEGLGCPYATGIWHSKQVAGWQLVTNAVHAAGGRIIAQLWHMGRAVHPSYLGRAQPVSASVTTAPGHACTYCGPQRHAAARALLPGEITGIIDDFAFAAVNAMAAGFDGVQLQASNGYLIEQFMRSGTNFRSDRYGGTTTKRLRLLKEVTEAIAAAIGAQRIGVRLSPCGTSRGVPDDNPRALFLEAAKLLSAIGIGHLELTEHPPEGNLVSTSDLISEMKEAFDGPVILNTGFERATAAAALKAGQGDAVAFGRLFIANPDLPLRLAKGHSLAEADRETWFSQEARGYTDYPAFKSR
jgi:2,4-dienoyl-CoA reductase-like NADH-dependent reductase (Old Yellow Enzyme family)